MDLETSPSIGSQMASKTRYLLSNLGKKLSLGLHGIGDLKAVLNRIINTSTIYKDYVALTESLYSGLRIANFLLSNPIDGIEKYLICRSSLENLQTLLKYLQECVNLDENIMGFLPSALPELANCFERRNSLISQLKVLELQYAYISIIRKHGIGYVIETKPLKICQMGISLLPL